MWQRPIDYDGLGPLVMNRNWIRSNRQNAHKIMKEFGDMRDKREILYCLVEERNYDDLLSVLLHREELDLKVDRRLFEFAVDEGDMDVMATLSGIEPDLFLVMYMSLSRRAAHLQKIGLSRGILRLGRSMEPIHTREVDPRHMIAYSANKYR
jgi:hypothetical protein